MKNLQKVLFLLLLCVDAKATITYDILEQTNLIQPYFRGETNTSYFGWDDSEFYGFPVPSVNQRILNNTPPSEGTSGILNNVQFYQNDRYSNNPVIIGSSGGNIYTGFGANGKQAYATLIAPTFTSLTNGFTTLIIQGRTVPAGGYAPIEMLVANFPRFTIDGISPYFVIGANASQEAQWWAQFNIPTVKSNYNILVDFKGGTNTYPISVAQMHVDTYVSSTGYANLTTVVPEPSTFFLILSAICLLIMWKIWRCLSK